MEYRLRKLVLVVIAMACFVMILPTIVAYLSDAFTYMSNSLMNWDGPTINR